jgi:hypothetical protein
MLVASRFGVWSETFRMSRRRVLTTSRHPLKVEESSSARRNLCESFREPPALQTYVVNGYDG